MAEPIVAQKSPYPVDVQAGKKYFWCACGRSKNQPFCDGSHAGSGFQPMKLDLGEAKRVALCQCKATHHAPMCDGTHKTVA